LTHGVISFTLEMSAFRTAQKNRACLRTAVRRYISGFSPRTLCWSPGTPLRE